MLYRSLIRPLLYCLPAETAHHLIIGALRLVQVIPLGLTLLRLLFRPRSAPVQALGLTFPNPVGMAAGFDKDARVFDALGALGFGFVEVGTVTAHGQPGNPKPRLFRLPADKALLNRMGFNNEGATSAAARLAARGRAGRPILGVNIGKSKITEAALAAADYEQSAEQLAPWADYLVVNVSSPNTPGLRDLQAVESLRPILAATRRALDRKSPERRVPLVVKIAPDLNDADIRATAELALEMGLDGIIATNTTIGRGGLVTPAGEVSALGAGGLSGRPLKERSLEVLRLLASSTGGRITLISAGGIETAADVQARLAAGATLVQVYSALVYEGPGLPSALTQTGSTAPSIPVAIL